MEVILEIGRPDGRRTWHPFDGPLTVGRALTNDIIVDDDYVDAHHLRLSRGEDGSVLLEDLGSVNGIQRNGQTIRGSTEVAVGSDITIGHTVLRFRDRQEQVRPALMLGAQVTNTALLVPSRPVVPVGWGGLAAMGTASVVFALNSWLGNTGRTGASDVMSVLLALWGGCTLWAAGWAVASRITQHRAFFGRHFLIATLACLAALLLLGLGEWVGFFFPSSEVPGFLISVLFMALASYTIVRHLAIASHMSPTQRMRVGITVAAVQLALLGVSALTDEEEFSDVPAFASGLKAIDPRFVPMQSVDDFGAGLAELREETDKLAKDSVQDSTEAP